MTDREPTPPGTVLVAALVAIGILATAWLRLGRVTVPQEQSDSPSASPVAWPDMRLDLNRASAAELTVLPGLGPRLAERIVEDRRLRGRFETVGDLDRVPGIGPAILERVAPHLVVEAE